jgi:hypothetical protein
MTVITDPTTVPMQTPAPKEESTEKMISWAHSRLNLIAATVGLVIAIGGPIMYVNSRFTLYEYVREQRNETIKKQSDDIDALKTAFATKEKADAEFRGETAASLRAIEKALNVEREDRKDDRSLVRRSERRPQESAPGESARIAMRLPP